MPNIISCLLFCIVLVDVVVNGGRNLPSSIVVAFTGTAGQNVVVQGDMIINFLKEQLTIL